jgi:hypothetical protein
VSPSTAKPGRAATAGSRPGAKPAAGAVTEPQPAAPALPEGWRPFIGRWLETAGCGVQSAARGDWEIDLEPGLRKRWRRQRVRLVFDPQRPTLPRGAWFTAPGSGGGRKILEHALEEPLVTRRTALAQVPGAPDNGIASVCRVRGLAWSAPRLGPVRYERRVAFHATISRWGGLPSQEPWVILTGPGGELLEAVNERALPDLRSREGLYQIHDEPDEERREAWARAAREHFWELLDEREREWESAIGRMRDEELDRLGAFFSARISEEEERLRRRTVNGDDSDLAHGDATSLKLEWERRAAEVRNRWALRTELRLWGIEEWSWPVADLEQELRVGAVHVKVESRVDVARGRPGLPACPHCGAIAEMLIRLRGHVACPRCAD